MKIVARLRSALNRSTLGNEVIFKNHLSYRFLRVGFSTVSSSINSAEFISLDFFLVLKKVRLELNRELNTKEASIGMGAQSHFSSMSVYNRSTDGKPHS